jgi:hypothetical protein
MMRHLLTGIALATLVACSGNSTTDPTTGGGGGSNGGGNGGGQNDGGNSGGGAPPLSAAVIVGNFSFTSGHNGTINAAVDTIAAGGTVTWTWTATGTVPHSIQSLGAPSFASSDILTGDGKSYQVQFTTPGTYQYDCAVHGTAMSGRIVVR